MSDPKRPDLPFRDDPPEEDPLLARKVSGVTDRREVGYLRFLARLEGLIEDERYGFCRSTLEGIHETVTASEYVTDNQQRAVDRIEESVESRGSISDRRFSSAQMRRGRY